MAKFRAVSRLYSQWLNEGKIKKKIVTLLLDFAAELGLIAEHTQGVDVKTHLRQWDKYDMDKFLKGRSEEYSVWLRLHGKRLIIISIVLSLSFRLPCKKRGA